MDKKELERPCVIGAVTRDGEEGEEEKEENLEGKARLHFSSTLSFSEKYIFSRKPVHQKETLCLLFLTDTKASGAPEQDKTEHLWLPHTLTSLSKEQSETTSQIADERCPCEG